MSSSGTTVVSEHEEYGVRFGLHSKNLEVGSDGFPPIETNLQNGVGLVATESVALTEPANVLVLLFSFLYPERIPESLGKDFKTVIALAEAAEKYQVHLAIRESKKHLRIFAKKHYLQITAFSMRHYYFDLLELTADLAVLRPLSEVIPRLPTQFILPWIKYHEQWQEVHMSLPSAMVACIYYKRTADTRFTECPTWSICQDGFLRRWYSYTPQGLSPLSDLDFLFSPPAEKVKDKTVRIRPCCLRTLLARKKRAAEMILGLKSFTEIWKSSVKS